MQPRWRIPKLVAVTAALAAVGAPPAAAYLTIGPDYQPDPATSQAISYPSGSLLFNAQGPPGIRLLSPIDGVVTGWRVALGFVPEGGTVQLRVISPAGGSNWTVRAGGPVEVLAADPTAHATVHAFSANVPIGTGDGVGVVKTHPAGSGLEITQPYDQGDPSWALGEFSSPPAEGITGTATVGNPDGRFRMIAADIEPDADRDRFGDDTQDDCPTVAGTAAGCPPAAAPPAAPPSRPATDAPAPAPVTDAPTVRVETITPAGALAQIDPRGVTLSRDRRRLTVEVVCPPQQAPRCTGRLAATVSRRATRTRRRKALQLGRARFAIAQGQTQVVTLRVPRRTRAAIERLGRLRLTVRLTETTQLTTSVGEDG